MAVMAAVDLGAQSGRVAVGRFDGSRLAVSEVHRFANEPVEVAGTLRWDIHRLRRDALDGLRAAGRDDRARLDRRRLLGGRLRPARPGGQSRREPRPLPRRASRGGGAGRRSRACPRGSSTSAPGSSCSRSTPCSSSPRWPPTGDPALESADVLLLIPDLFHHWLCGSRTTEFTNATTTQCLDAASGGWATDLLERLEIPTRLFPDVVAPGTPLGPVTRGRWGSATAVVIAVATHDTGSAVAAVPFNRAGSIFLSVGTWSLVGIEVERAADQRRDVRREPDERGRRGGDVPAAPQRHGPLAAATSAGAAGRRKARSTRSRSSSPSRGSAPPLRSFVDPNAELFLERGGDMPRRIRAFCRRHEPAGAGRRRRDRPLRPREPRAEARGDGRRAARRSPARIPPSSTSSAAARGTSSSAPGRPRPTGLPVLAGPEEATLLGNLLVQAIALGEIGSLAEARDVVRASFEPTAYEPDALRRVAGGATSGSTQLGVAGWR